MRSRKDRLGKAILGMGIVLVVVLFGTRIFFGTESGVSAVCRDRSPESLRLVVAVLHLTGRTMPAPLQSWMCGQLRRVPEPATQDRIIEWLVPPFRQFRGFDVNTSSPLLGYLELPPDAHRRIDTIPLSTRHAIIDALLQRADPKLPWRSYKDLVMVHLLSSPLDGRYQFHSLRGPMPGQESYDKWWETEAVAPAIEAYRDWWKTTKDVLAPKRLYLLDN